MESSMETIDAHWLPVISTENGMNALKCCILLFITLNNYVNKSNKKTSSSFCTWTFMVIVQRRMYFNMETNLKLSVKDQEKTSLLNPKCFHTCFKKSSTALTLMIALFPCLNQKNQLPE